MVPYDITAIRDRFAENWEEANQQDRRRDNNNNRTDQQTTINTSDIAKYMGYQNAMLQRMMETLDNINYSLEKMANHQCLVNALQAAHGQWQFNADRLGENGESLIKVKGLLEGFAQVLGGYSDEKGSGN